MENNTKTIEVHGHSQAAWADAQPEINALKASGYTHTNSTTEGMTTVMHFTAPSQAQLGAAVERGADDFENTYLAAVRLTANHFGITEEKAQSWIRIGGKIHSQREANKALTPADDSGEPEWLARHAKKLKLGE